jgi:hypothetical protein
MRTVGESSEWFCALVRTRPRQLFDSGLACAAKELEAVSRLAQGPGGADVDQTKIYQPA